MLKKTINTRAYNIFYLTEFNFCGKIRCRFIKFYRQIAFLGENPIMDSNKTALLENATQEKQDKATAENRSLCYIKGCNE